MSSYEENFANALETVYAMRRMAENAWVDELHEAADAILELQAEAYHLGHNNGMKLVATMLVTDEVPAVVPNPYRKTQ
jgi:trimethylamine:corrinoid methyltransferase-like protein